VPDQKESRLVATELTGPVIGILIFGGLALLAIIGLIIDPDQGQHSPGWSGGSAPLPTSAVTTPVTPPVVNAPPRVKPKPPPRPIVAPTIDAELKQAAIAGISQYREVVDASVGQRGSKVVLVIIVRYGTTNQRARSLCDNFVRMVKTISQDENPTREIGRGLYDYLVSAHTPDGKEIADGAKASSARSLFWF